MIECDDCVEGQVAWANQKLEDTGYSVRRKADLPLDAPTVITSRDLHLP